LDLVERVYVVFQVFDRNDQRLVETMLDFGDPNKTIKNCIQLRHPGQLKSRGRA